MTDHSREESGTALSRRSLLVRGGLLGLFALVAPSLLAADDAEAGHSFKRRRAVKVKHRGFKRHAKFGKRRGFKGHVRFKKHAGFKKHRGFKAHVRFSKRAPFRKHDGFKKMRFVRFKKRW